MPEKATINKARAARRAGKAPTTQAGEFVREEIHHVREGKHGARSPEQAIAIGLSKARRAGVKLPRPPARRARATSGAMKRQPRSAASRQALSRHAQRAARRRSPAERSRTARRAAKTRRRRAQNSPS